MLPSTRLSAGTVHGAGYGGARQPSQEHYPVPEEHH